MIQKNAKEFSRPVYLCRQIVVLDGLTGTGKTMFSPFLNSFKRMQNLRFEYMFEYLCIAAKMSKLTKDGAHSLLNLLADVKYYDGTISREVNFRPNDLSSIFNSSNAIKYIRQLWAKDGKYVEDRIARENPILLLATHQLLSCIEPAFLAFGDRLKIIEMVRHPLYILDHWESYVMLHGNSARDTTVWIDESGRPVPWFSLGWEELFVNSTSYDRAVYSINSLMQVVLDKARSEENKQSMMFIPFEKFVLNPTPYIKELEEYLDTEIRPVTWKVLRKQKVPRVSINAGPQKSIYKRYALKKYDPSISHEQDYQLKIESAQSHCSVEAYKVMEQLSKKYENTFGLWF